MAAPHRTRFGDIDEGTGSTSRAETTDKPSEPTLDSTMETTLDPTRAASSDDGTTIAETGDATTGTTQPMTSDDGTDDTSTSTDTTATDVGNPAAEVLLYTAEIDDGQLSMDGGGPAMQVGAMICAQAMEDFGVDLCNGTYHALIRTGPLPFAAPELVENFGSGVYSLEGDAVAETLEDFLDGDWLVPALTSASGGGLDELAFTPFVTGGMANEDVNCAGWTTLDGDMTIGDVDAGGGWFSAGDIACSSPARMLCLCLP